jgi:hypothetical protein
MRAAAGATANPARNPCRAARVVPKMLHAHWQDDPLRATRVLQVLCLLATARDCPVRSQAQYLGCGVLISKAVAVAEALRVEGVKPEVL